MLKKILIPALVLCVIAVTAFVENPSKELRQNRPEAVDKGYAPIVVLELFTSQGCSSCPAADNLLDQVKETWGDAVITLSYHVDYWNYIGWEDPFSNAQYSRKQLLYNQKFKNNSNYTPQMVVNGKEHFVGSNSTKLHSKIATYKKVSAENEVVLTEIEKETDKVKFSYRIAGEIENKNIKALLVLDRRTTNVKRGENRHRTLVNSNIVIAEHIENIVSKEGTMNLDIPKKIGAQEKISLVLLIENDTYDITAAGKSKIMI